MGEILTEQYRNLSDNELICRINAGEYELLQYIITRYLPMIKKLADGYAGCGCDDDDLVQEGVIGLFSAVRGFDESKSAFSTFAYLCIKRSMAGEIKSAGRKGRIPDKLFLPLEDVEVADSNSPEKIFFDREDYKSLTDTIRVGLSALEYKVLCAFLAGRNYTDIADELKISVKSVDNSLRRIRTKLRSLK